MEPINRQAIELALSAYKLLKNLSQHKEGSQCQHSKFACMDEKKGHGCHRTSMPLANLSLNPELSAKQH
ncbi:hypothetical protein [Oceanobacillus saliphilus]|uniref:hypothetical protein n=1 Tax=Oceanobacillus saliphilus TaxID=2925834 RepID=UPI00201E6300|nr:hypothetical protein [Oceanobacillus saliphilus]